MLGVFQITQVKNGIAVGPSLYPLPRGRGKRATLITAHRHSGAGVRRRAFGGGSSDAPDSPPSAVHLPVRTRVHNRVTKRWVRSSQAVLVERRCIIASSG